MLHIWKIVHTFAMQFGRMDYKGNKSAYIEWLLYFFDYVRHYLLLCSAGSLLEFVFWSCRCCGVCLYRATNPRC